MHLLRSCVTVLAVSASPDCVPDNNLPAFAYHSILPPNFSAESAQAVCEATLSRNRKALEVNLGRNIRASGRDPDRSLQEQNGELSQEHIFNSIQKNAIVRHTAENGEFCSPTS